MSSRRGLQVLILLCALVPLVFGALGMALGWARFTDAPLPDHDNVYRFLSALYFTVGVLFLYVLPRVERETTLIRILAAGVALGAVSRAVSWATVGEPRLLFQLDIVAELLLPAVVVVWQSTLARPPEPRAASRPRGEV